MTAAPKGVAGGVVGVMRRLLAFFGMEPAERLPTLDGFRGLHPETLALVRRFAYALACKLSAAEQKYGYSDGWKRDDWMDECRAHLVEHVAKGDPRDVAAYCAFLWHHDERTALPAVFHGTAPATGVDARGIPLKSIITLTGMKIRELAELVGYSVSEGEGGRPEFETRVTISACPPGGIWNAGEPGEPDYESHYEFVAHLTDHPEEGCIGLGSELPAPSDAGASA